MRWCFCQSYANDCKDILCSELVCAHWDAVDKLHGTPEPMELHALVHMHDTVAGWRSAPHAVLKKAANACEDNLEHRQAAAQPLLGQQVSFSCYSNLLSGRLSYKYCAQKTSSLFPITYFILHVEWYHYARHVITICLSLTCGVPSLSMRGTKCRGAYFASSLFILTSNLSPSTDQAIAWDEAE